MPNIWPWVDGDCHVIPFNKDELDLHDEGVECWCKPELLLDYRMPKVMRWGEDFVRVYLHHEREG
jgi:hypothetical protein